jgi:hypothetical protein
MLPAKINLPVIWRGCDWAATTFRWKNADGLPINVSAWTPFVETEDFSLNPVKTDPTGGTVSLSLTKEQTATLKLGVYSWDWIWQSNGSRLPPLIGGRVEVKQPTTTP